MTDDKLWIDAPDDLAEQPAARPRKRKTEPFAQVPLAWAKRAALSTSTLQALVWVWLLHLTWKTKSNTVTLSSAQLKVRGVSPHVKRRALANLENDGLIKVSRRKCKNPTVTLLGL